MRGALHATGEQCLRGAHSLIAAAAAAAAAMEHRHCTALALSVEHTLVVCRAGSTPTFYIFVFIMGERHDTEQSYTRKVP
jgi:hypothetical protein